MNKFIITPIIFFDLFPVFYAIVGVYGALNPATEFEIPKVFIIDYVFRIPSWFIIIFIVQVVLLSAPVDLTIYALEKLKINVSKKIKIYTAKYFLLLVIFFVGYIPLRAYYEYKNVMVEKRIYYLKSGSSSLNNFRIAFISDIQADRFTNESRVNNYISKLNELNPDLVLAGGDFVTGDSSYIPIIKSLVKNIKSNYGVYSTVGDHDFFAFKKQYWRSLAEVKNALAEVNVKMIDNGNLILYLNDNSIKATFLSNTYVKPYDEIVFDSLAKTNQDAALKILITHQPDEKIALKAKSYGYNLYLSGHTHGGQVNFLFPFVKVTPVIFETKFISGDYWFNGMLMIVNRGLGMSTMPIRYHALPEISLIEIKIEVTSN
ncbi:MAG: metallophosphoesterase [Ignavibacteria bacterium]|nr:metallophosphoesterase [Ignavibacteria bacterium]